MFLFHRGLAIVDEVQDRLEDGGVDATEVEDGVEAVRVLENPLEERAAGCQNKFVCLKLALILADEGHIEKFFLCSQNSKRL